MAVIVLAFMTSLAACSGSGATVEASASPTRTQNADTLSSSVADPEEEASDDRSSADLAREMERDLFDRLYNRYQPVYNEMIQEYFSAQTHLSQGNYARARAAARRASSILPNQASYELLLVILERTGAEQELIDEWTTRLEHLRTLEEQGLYLSPEGEILGVDGQVLRTDSELGALELVVPPPR